MSVLGRIQNAVKVTKNLHNQFGNFNYRNVESIYKDIDSQDNSHNHATPAQSAQKAL
mgnify:CR=1 FL=1